MMHISPQQLAAALGGEARGNKISAPGPGHSVEDRSLSILIDPSAPDGFVVYSHAGEDALPIKDYVRERAGLGKWEPARKPRVDNIARMANRVCKPVAKAGSAPAEYIYRLEDGTPYLRVVRPGFYQSHWDGSSWVNGAPEGPKIPYRLRELLEAEHDTVLIVEGEKDADNLAALGLLATTNSGGAEKWTADLNQYFKDREVYILPDNDEPGERHAKQVVEELTPVAREVRVVRLPDLPPKGDVSDWLAAGGTADKLAQLMEAAPAVSKEPEASALIISSAEFLEGFVPPDYMIDGLVQRRFCYSLTAPTGHGKTAVALLLAASKALGLPVGGHDVEPGRVVYFVGENPDDVRMRWIALSEKMGFDPKAIDVHFRPGTCKLSELVPKIRQEVQSIGGVSFVVVDTSAAYNESDDENANIQAGTHARLMRSLVTLPGEPCVVVLCHPVKNAGHDNLLPRGGGAFLAEVDGNLTCWKTDSLVSLHWQGKFRGPDFAPITFALETVTSSQLRDSKGRPIPSVIAKALSDQEKSRAEASSRDDEDAMLLVIDSNPGASFAGLAVALGWISSKGENKTKVKRCADRLKADKLVNSDRRGTLKLTDKGETEVKRLRANQRQTLSVSG